MSESRTVKIVKVVCDLRQTFCELGIDPEGVIKFIEDNIDTAREAHLLKKGYMNKTDYIKEQKSINETELLKIYLKQHKL